MRKILLLLFALTVLTGQAAAAILVPESSSGTYISKANLEEAAIAADAAGKTVVVTSAISVSSSLTWPADRALKVEKGGLITVAAGKTLTVSGSFSAGLYQVFSGTGRVVFAAGAVAEVFPEWWGKSTAAIQAAVNSLQSGGTVSFSGNYNIDSTVTIASEYPVNLIGRQHGQTFSPVKGSPTISITAKIAGPAILYTAPNAGARGHHGGGKVKGLTFIDPTGSGANPGRHSVTAAVMLHDFALSSVEECTFQWIKGSAVAGEFLVMSSLSNNIVRYCGDSGKPAINLPSTSSSYPAQALTIFNNRVEVCHLSPYIKIGNTATDIKIVNNGFEADTATAKSNQPFIDTGAAQRGVISGNHFNRNTSTQLKLSGSLWSVIGNTFAGGPYATTAVVCSGNKNTLGNNSFVSTRTALEILISGDANSFTGNAMYYSGGLNITGSHNTVSGNTLSQLTLTDALYPYWISSSGNANVVSGNTLWDAGGLNAKGGIRVSGTMPTVTGNNISSLKGQTAYRIETPNAIITGNGETGCGASFSATSYSSEFSGNLFTTSGSPLSASASVTPGIIADGASYRGTIAVTGAAVGDYVQVSLNAAIAGLEITGWVAGTDSVSFTLTNKSGSPQKIGKSFLKARCFKR